MKICTRKELREQYLVEKEKLVKAMLRMEERHGHMGVMAAFQSWMKKPYRGGFDYWTKGPEA
jgi:hypothetical protein